MNFEGLRDDVLSMIAGESVPVNTGSFQNDMTTFYTEDDVLTLLIHLGYLAYDYDHKTVKIPNSEVRAEYVNSVSVSDWGEISKALKNSRKTGTCRRAEVGQKCRGCDRTDPKKGILPQPERVSGKSASCRCQL